MRDSEITKFLVSFSGQIEYVSFPGGVFDDQLCVHYEVVWGPDWSPMSGLTSGTSQMARSGVDPERVVFNFPLEIVFSSTNVSGWPQLLVTVRAQNTLSGDALRGYSLLLMPPTPGHLLTSAPLLRPRAATVLGEWLAWITGKYPELADPKMLASGKDNYLLRTESYGSVSATLNMISKDFRKLGYDNQPPFYNTSNTTYNTSNR
ncbi:unnamed protein product [Arctia plantaginis]|uniref:B9 domain-containing protein 1 n=1 Tax=Arctia plantaginis TaxID=874455 RepID=A0A8S1B398_ARCPL|nr:unnamed protein product [Arctia plantaginis]